MNITALYSAFLHSTGICTDTRKIKSGNMFLALKGPNFNGNEFAAKALEAGCAYAVIDEEAYKTDDRFILVSDGLKALQKLANHHRQQFPALVVLGITGSNGKTTTKELLHAVVSQNHEVLATKGNLNNHIGVPLTLLEIKETHSIAIVEMGANKPGDIQELCDIANPNLGLITNIGEAHLEGLGGLAGVLETKTALYRHIRAHGGTVYVNAADPTLIEAAKGMHQFTYGIECGDVSGHKTSTGNLLSFTYTADGKTSAVINTQVFGDHNMTNALAAVAFGLKMNTHPKAIQEALVKYTPDNNRSQWQQTERNTLIMDAYNANPTSVIAAIESLASLETDQKKLVILGDMFEMGDSTERAHAEVVAAINKHAVDAWLIGPDYQAAAGGLRAFANTNEAAEALRSEALTNRCILVKGSRGMKLEQLYDLL